MSTTADTLSRALEIYNNRYQDALRTNSKREIERFKSNTNQLNTYYDIVGQATAENNGIRAQTALDAMVDILLAEGITITNPVTPPLGIGLSTSPYTICVPTDNDGTNPNYTNAYSDVVITEGTIDKTSTWRVTIVSTTSCSATVSSNRVTVTSITADTGMISVVCIKTGYSNLPLNIKVVKAKKGETGDPATVDNVTIEVNLSGELALIDSSIDATKINFSKLFSLPNSIHRFRRDLGDSSLDVLYPANFRRAFGSGGLSYETGRSVGYGQYNITLGTDNLNGPGYTDNFYGSPANTFEYVNYGGVPPRIYLNSSYGDITSFIPVGQKYIAYMRALENETQYYVVGTVDSVGYDGYYTYFTVTPDFTPEDEVLDTLFWSAIVPSSNHVVTFYTPHVGTTFTGNYSNIIIGRYNEVNGAFNTVIGNYWGITTSPYYYAGNSRGNILIGYGSDYLNGDANIIISPQMQYTCFIDVDTRYNVLFGSFHQVGSTTGVNYNVLLGNYSQVETSGTTGLGHAIKSKLTDGEVVIGCGDINRRFVIAQLIGSVTSTSYVTLQTFVNAAPVVNSFVTQCNIGIEINSLYKFVIDLTGVRTTDGLAYTKRIISRIKNVGGTTSFDGSNTEVADYDSNTIGDLEYLLTADNTNDELVIQVRKGVGNPTGTIKFTATVKYEIIEW